MKSRGIERLLRFLLILLGIGIGLAATQLGLDLYRMSNPDTVVSPYYLVAAYAAMGAAGGLILLLFSRRILRRFSDLSSVMRKQIDRMPVYQLLSAVLGLILGLIVAALLRQMIPAPRSDVFLTALSAILYLSLGALGYGIGKHRSREVIALLTRVSGAREKSKTRRHGYAARKYMDTSALIDGRVLEIAKTGFLEGEIVIPQFVVDELRHVADSADDSRRERGRHGLEILRAMQEELRQVRLDDADEPDIQDVDVKLLRQAREWGGTVITVDYNLQKAAAVSGIRTLNVNELVEALRPAVTQGMELTVRLAREGKENRQAVGYLSDGTMIVVENARQLIGEKARVQVTSVLQTSAGRMVFAKLPERAEEENRDGGAA